MRLILDVENTVTKRNDKLHLDLLRWQQSCYGWYEDRQLGRVVTFDHAHDYPHKMVMLLYRDS